MDVGACRVTLRKPGEIKTCAAISLDTYVKIPTGSSWVKAKVDGDLEVFKRIKQDGHGAVVAIHRPKSMVSSWLHRCIRSEMKVYGFIL